MQAGTVAAAAAADNSTAKDRKPVSWTASRMPVVGLRCLCCGIDRIRLEEGGMMVLGRVFEEARIVNSQCCCC